MSGMFTDRDDGSTAGGPGQDPAAGGENGEVREAEPLPEGTAPAGTPGRRRHRTVLVAAAFVVVTAVAVVGALGLGGGGAEGPEAPPRAGATVAVTRTTLVERTKVEGTLGYGTETPLPVKATGTVTWLPEAGATAERGDTLLRVDDRPVVLLYGTLPMYRELGLTAAATAPETGASPPPTPGGTGDEGSTSDPRGGTGSASNPGGGTGSASDPGGGTGSGKGTAPPPATPTQPPPPPQPLRGMDVLQFESNLAALGYGGFTVDEKFTSATERAVKDWQKALGVPRTGRIGLGDIVYASGRVRLGQAGVRLGSAAGEDVLTYTGTTRKVVVNASALEASWAVRGAGVTVGLPDGTPVKGEVAAIGRQATAPEGDSGPPTVPITITVPDQRALGRLESGPVSVEYVGRERENVLAVPVAALVALAEGGHGLETEDGRFVAARTGLFADGLVEVSGPKLREGLKVRIPQ
ncbi:peptidoglycan-binding protein [Streptomyces sp. NPDC058326]|uniref:peptidoglycan-binding protein n=1 Tax=Streptomyces sp. NPDC058326 TaxID=3346447 RepID=UPI0036EF6E82